MSITVTVNVDEIQKGDEFWYEGKHQWTALDDAEEGFAGDVILKVQHWPDGGIATREWSDKDQELKITRPR